MILIPHEKYERLRQQNTKTEEGKEKGDRINILQTSENNKEEEEDKLNEVNILNNSETNTPQQNELTTDTTPITKVLTQETHEIEESKKNKKRIKKHFPPPGIPYKGKEKKQKTDWKTLWEKY